MVEHETQLLLEEVMATWQTVRFDPTYEEPLDPEIIPLCDALQAAGFNTVSSCFGHGLDWPRVWWNSSTPDIRSESLARFLLRRSGGDYKPFTPFVQKEILDVGHRWMLEIHVHDTYCDTPQTKAREMAAMAVMAVTKHVGEWAEAVKP